LFLSFVVFWPAEILAQVPGGFALQVNGQVRYAESKVPADNVLVRIEAFDGGNFNQIMTDRTGKFSFAGLRPISYIITVHMPGYIDYSERVDLQVNPSPYLNVLLMADKNSIQNRVDQMISLAPAVIDSNTPPEARNEYQTGKALLDQGKQDKITEATVHFQKALAIYPKFLDAELMLGLAYMDLAQWDQAEKALLAAIGINPNASTAYFALGSIYAQQKNYPKAEEVLAKGVKLNDAAPEGHYMLADVYWNMANAGSTDANKLRSWFESSWREVKRSLELNPKLASAHLLSGNLLLKAQRAKEALDHFEQYLKLEPKGQYAEQTKVLVDKIKKALADSDKKT
jgi:tetratricopeptide (TPR) repeat protein